MRSERCRVEGHTEVENGEVAADNAAADRLALALSGAAGAVAAGHRDLAMGKGRRAGVGEGEGEGTSCCRV